MTRTVRCSSSPGRGRSSRLGGLFFGGRQKGLGGLSLRAGRHGGADLAGQWTRCPGHLLDAQFVAAKKPVELRCAGIKQPGQSRHDHEWSYEHSGVKVQAGQRQPQSTPGASGSGGRPGAVASAKDSRSDAEAWGFRLPFQGTGPGLRAQVLIRLGGGAPSRLCSGKLSSHRRGHPPDVRVSAGAFTSWPSRLLVRGPASSLRRRRMVIVFLRRHTASLYPATYQRRRRSTSYAPPTQER